MLSLSSNKLDFVHSEIGASADLRMDKVEVSCQENISTRANGFANFREQRWLACPRRGAAPEFSRGLMVFEN